MPPIILYTYVTSPYAMKVHCYLLYKQLPFKVYYVNPLRITRELPLGRKIPVLKIGDEVRGDSSLLGSWLDEKFPDTLQLLPVDAKEREKALTLDHWISEHLIPILFYSIYPQFNALFFRNISNSMRLGYCVDRTTTTNLPLGMRFLWPLFLRNARFIRRMVKVTKEQGSVHYCRNMALSYLEKKLEKQQYLVGTDNPSLADISVWPLLVVPYKIGLRGFDDFKSYPNISRWIVDIQPFITASDHAQPLIPKILLSCDI